MKDMERFHERDKVGVEDFVLLENFRDQSAFIENLQKRFKENLIYVSLEFTILKKLTKNALSTNIDLHRTSARFSKSL